MEKILDCGDSSCLYAPSRSGMRTNGGCRCLKDLDIERRRKAHEYIMALREENARLKMEADGQFLRQQEVIGRICRERDEARAEVLYEQDRNRNNVAQYTAEVSRLEGLILDWAALPVTASPEVVGFSDAMMIVEARRIRAQREEGR